MSVQTHQIPGTEVQVLSCHAGGTEPNLDPLQEQMLVSIEPPLQVQIQIKKKTNTSELDKTNKKKKGECTRNREPLGHSIKTLNWRPSYV